MAPCSPLGRPRPSGCRRREDPESASNGYDHLRPHPHISNTKIKERLKYLSKCVDLSSVTKCSRPFRQLRKFINEITSSGRKKACILTSSSFLRHQFFAHCANVQKRYSNETDTIAPSLDPWDEHIVSLTITFNLRQLYRKRCRQCDQPSSKQTLKSSKADPESSPEPFFWMMLFVRPPNNRTCDEEYVMLWLWN